MLRTIFVVCIMALLGSIHYHYGNQEHYKAYHTVAGVLEQYFNSPKDNKTDEYYHYCEECY